MGQLFAHMGRQSGDTKLFTKSPMMQNLLDIEKATGGGRYLKAVDDELKRQRKVLELREGNSPLRQVSDWLQQQGDKVQRLFGNEPSFVPTSGETSGPGGLPGLSSKVYINTEDRAPTYRRTLKERNPYVQSLLDTVQHEIGGHVMQNLTPGHSVWKGPENEATAQGLVGEGEQPMTSRGQEVKKYFGFAPRDVTSGEY